MYLQFVIWLHFNIKKVNVIEDSFSADHTVAVLCKPCISIQFLMG